MAVKKDATTANQTDAKKVTTKKTEKVETAKPEKVETAKTEKVEAKKPEVKKADAPKKAPAKKYHISQRNEDNMWQVKAEGAEKALKLFKTQQEAIDYAKKVADNQLGYIMIHKKDGSFRKLTY